MFSLRFSTANNQRDGDLYSDARTSDYNCSLHRAIETKPVDMILSKMPTTRAIQKVLSLSAMLGYTEFKRKYFRWLRNMRQEVNVLMTH